MRIIVDKIDDYPRHAISRADIRLIFSAVPSPWIAHVKVVRLSSSQSATSVALYARSVETLTIASRGYTKENTLRLVLTELAAHAVGFKHRTFQHLQSRHESTIAALIAPILEELLPQL